LTICRTGARLPGILTTLARPERDVARRKFSEGKRCPMLISSSSSPWHEILMLLTLFVFNPVVISKRGTERKDDPKDDE
jgi:hypothetical protein